MSRDAARTSPCAADFGRLWLERRRSRAHRRIVKADNLFDQRETICPTLSAYRCALARGVLVTNATLAAPGGITSILVAAGKWSTDLYQ